jgi:hypothetical protein
LHWTTFDDANVKLKAQPIRQTPSAHLGGGPDSWVPGYRLKMVFSNQLIAMRRFCLPPSKTRFPDY